MRRPSGRTLAGVSVVVTRAREQSETLVRALTDEGASVVALPVVTFVDPPDGGEGVRRARGLLSRGRYEWVVFTSVNAVERFLGATDDADALGRTRIAAVGDATASSLAARGLLAELVPEKASAEELAAVMPETRGAISQAHSSRERRRVLFPRASGASDALASRLRAKGWEVDDVVAYRTVSAGPSEGVTYDALEAASRADVVTFTSPSTVRFFLELMQGRRVPPLVACIGPVTARAATDAGLRVEVVSEEQSALGLVRSIVENLLIP